MINAAVIGYGNIGKYAVEAILEAPDFKLVGVVTLEFELEKVRSELKGVTVVTDIKELEKADVAILAVPSRGVPETAKKYLSLGMNTVDCYDIHTGILELKRELASAAVSNNAVSVVSSGMDPGSCSIIRGLMEATTPKGLTHTNYGEGMSMGHTVAVKSKDGVKNALSVTVPLGTGIHRRLVYVELEDGADFAAVEKAIKEDSYFVKDETHVMQTKDVAALIDVGHGANIVRKGVSGKTHNQFLEFNMKVNNPAFTSQAMVCCARASMKLAPGSYTMIEIPVINLIYGEHDDIIKRLV